MHQIIDVPKRDKSILDWCLVNSKGLRFQATQLTPIGSSDHNTVIVKSTLERSGKPSKKIYKRDIRDSSIRPFGQWIVSYDWSDVFAIEDCLQKFDRFNEVLSSMVELYFPYKLPKIGNADKPWMSSSLKYYIRKRQLALH